MMDALAEFEKKLFLYDGMLIETGGSFGRGELGGASYEAQCLELARNYLAAGGGKEKLLEIAGRYIQRCSADPAWRYCSLEMAFLHRLNEKINRL